MKDGFGFGKAFTIGTNFSNSCEGRTQKFGGEIEEPFMRMIERSIKKLRTWRVPLVGLVERK